MTGETGKRVLLVEDDPLSLKLMRDVLAASGFETDAVTNGLDVFERLHGQRVDLVVMDIGLPGLDGVEVTRRLRQSEATTAIPVVAVTAYAMPEDERRITEAGCDVYLTKPLDYGSFVSVVRALISGREPHDAPPAGTET